MALEARRYDVRTATGGEEAIEIAEGFRPHMILLDLGMPGMDGYEVARRVRRRPWGDGVILVACTGWGGPEHRQQSREAGFDHHLVKPVKTDSVTELLTGVGKSRRD